MLRCCDQAINIPWTLYKSKSLFVVPKKTVGRATTTMVPPGARRSAERIHPVSRTPPPPPLFSLFSILLLNALCVPFWARRAARWALNVRGRLKHADTRKLVACAWRVSSVSLSISPRPPKRPSHFFELHSLHDAGILYIRGPLPLHVCYMRHVHAALAVAMECIPPHARPSRGRHR